MLARHCPNCLPPVDELSMVFKSSLFRNIFFSRSESGCLVRRSLFVRIFVRSLINGVKFGDENDPPISALFSPGAHNGLFLPSMKSHALSTNCTLIKNSRPMVFSGALSPATLVVSDDAYTVTSAPLSVCFDADVEAGVSSPHPKAERISRKESKRDQFLATWVLRRLKHFMIN